MKGACDEKELQGIVFETILGRKNSVQGPLLLKLLFVCLKQCLYLFTKRTILQGPRKLID